MQGMHINLHGQETYEIYKKLIPTTLTNIYYSINSYTTIYAPYNWPAFLAISCLNIGYVSSYGLIRIHN